MKKPRRDPIREDRIENEAIVDARPEEQAMGWYYYLENKLSFPFQAKCISADVVSPLCANMTDTSSVTAIREQGGKENQHGNDERFCSARCRCDGSI